MSLPLEPVSRDGQPTTGLRLMAGWGPRWRFDDGLPFRRMQYRGPITPAIRALYALNPALFADCQPDVLAALRAGGGQ